MVRPTDPVDMQSLRTNPRRAILDHLAKHYTYRAIGEALGVSRQRIEQIARQENAPRKVGRPRKYIISHLCDLDAADRVLDGNI